MNSVHSRIRVFSLAAAAAVLSAWLAPGQVAAPDKAEEGWLNLLEGKDLSEHWTTSGNWNLDEGVVALVPRKGESGTGRFEDYLWSEEQYEDFQIKFEYKVLGGGHSAFFFHVKDNDNPIKTGIEVTLAGKSAAAAKSGQPAAGTIVGIPPTKHAVKPDGQWNAVDVSVRDNVIVVTLNGEVVNEVRHNHPSILNRPFTGVIGFQDAGLPFWLRDVRIRVEKDEQVTVVQNSAAHPTPVLAMAFTPKADRLITAQRGEVRVWGVASGELERVWRLPTPIAPVLAPSPDGKTVAVPRNAPGSNGCIWLLDLETGGHRAISGLPGPAAVGIRTLSYSGDGRALAFSGPITGVCDTQAGRLTHVLGEKGVALLNKDGTHLLLTPGTVRRMRSSRNTDPKRKGGPYELVPIYNPHVYDVLPPKGGKGVIRLTKPRVEVNHQFLPPLKALWAPDGNRFVTLAAAHRFPTEGEMHVYNADGKHQPQKDTNYGMRVADYPPAKVRMQFFNPRQMLLDMGQSAGGGLTWKLAWLNIQSEKITQAKFQTDAYQFDQVRSSQCSSDGKFLALNLPGHVALWNLETGKVRRLDPPLETPAALAWSPDSRSIAWSLKGQQGPRQAADQKLTGGLRLTTLDQLPPGQLDGFEAGAQPKGWDFKLMAGKGKASAYALTRDGQRTDTDWTEAVQFWHVSRDGKGSPRLVVGGFRSVGVLDPETGKTVASVKLPQTPSAAAVSPDGQFCLYATGGREIYLNRIDPRAPLLTVLPSGGDWVAWTPQGYYAATPGGERLIGFLTRQDNFTPLTFNPVDRFRKRLYRPDILKLVLEKATVEEAIKVANAERGEKTGGDVKINDMMPPRAVLTVVDQSQLPTVKLKAQAEASTGKQPVTALRLLVDGRPLTGGIASENFEGGKKQAEAEWTVTLPPGKHQLAALARCPDSSSVSGKIEVEVADPDKLAYLHVLAVGVSDYEDPSLKLDFAAKDAQDLTAAFQKACKGDLFKDVRPEVLVNAAARKEAVLKAVAGMRSRVKPNDLVVVYFAGHGVKEKDKFYLLNVEVKTDDLAGTAVSGDDLRKALAEFPCQVLLILDACHSSAGVRNLRPAVDEVTRSLTEDEVGVAVLCSAMAHEKALEREGNGLFTRAVVDALNRSEGVPYNTSSRLFYVHHLHTYVFDRVSDQSGGRQHPFLSLPWVVESFPVARFPAKAP